MIMLISPMTLPIADEDCSEFRLLLTLVETEENSTGCKYSDAFSVIGPLSLRTRAGSTKVRTTYTTACYRKARIANKCPLEFNANLAITGAQCPLTCPIEAVMKCVL